MTITRQQFAEMIDHTLLRPEASREDVKKLCGESVRYGFKAVCLNPVHIADAASWLKGTKVIICSVVGFPLGTHSPETKAFETRKVIKEGAREVDMVIRIGALKEGMDSEVLEDIRVVVQAAGGHPVKVIIETCLLTDAEKVRACKLAMETGASFVKTSTGFAAAGATVQDVALMRATVGPGFGVKAAGGIRTLQDALRMIAAGANRLGMSASVAIMKQFEEMNPAI